MGLGLVLVFGAPAGASPTVDALNPPAGEVGHVVTLQGRDLAGASLSVRFGRAQAIDAHNPGRSDRLIRLLVPNKIDPRDPDTVTVAVKVDGIEAVMPAGPLQFTYSFPRPLPSITDVATADPSRPRTVSPDVPFVLTLIGSDFLQARRVPQRCIALGGQVLESSDLASPSSDSRVSFSFPGLSAAGDYEFLVAFSDGSGASIRVPNFVQERRIFGEPPVIQQVSFESNPQESIRCEITRLVEDYFCTLGVPGATASPGVFIGGNYTLLRMRARVTDQDSTPAQSDILLVSASYIDWINVREVSLVLFDDGSANKFSFAQKSSTVGEDCTVDPSGACVCSLKQYLVDSNDAVPGDGEFSRTLALVDLAVNPLLQDCIMEQDHVLPVRLAAGTTLDFRIEAVDRMGNLSAWPLRPTVTIGTSSFSCSGDECGCCILTSTDPAGECGGKPGMPSTDFPAGICISLF